MIESPNKKTGGLASGGRGREREEKAILTSPADYVFILPPVSNLVNPLFKKIFIFFHPPFPTPISTPHQWLDTPNIPLILFPSLGVFIMAYPPKSVQNLVETFDRNIDAYHSQQYNETQLRREFVDPFFEELGWDVSNKLGYAQAYKEVIHEDAVKVGAATKAPDYSFRVGGTRKFFLEAKKPSIDIKGDPHPAYQLRRYAWSAKLPLSILTDFEEFAVYDCRMRPKQTDAFCQYLTHEACSNKIYL